MVLLDSNIIIYLRDPRYSDRILEEIGTKRVSTCNVIVSEVLGYREINTTEYEYFNDFFSAVKNHMFDSEVTNKVIAIRRERKIKLSDAIIAATACVNNAVLWTHNLEDFQGIDGLQLFDPI